MKYFLVFFTLLISLFVYSNLPEKNTFILHLEPENRGTISFNFEVLEEYENFLVINLYFEEEKSLVANGYKIEKLILNPLRAGNGLKIDTSNYFNLEDVFEKIPGFFIIQFYGPIKNEWIEKLEEIGIEKLNSAYFNPYGLIFWINSTEEFEKLRTFKFINWVGPYDGIYKTSLIEKGKDEDKPIKVRIKVKSEKEVNKVLMDLKLYGIEILEINIIDHYLATPSIIAYVQKDAISMLTKIPEVWWVEEMIPMELYLATAREIHQTGVGNGCTGNLSEVPVWAQGITGAGSSPLCGGTKGTEQLVGIIDTTYNSPDFDCDQGIPNCTIMKYINYGPTCNINSTVNNCISGHSHGSGSAGVILGNGDQSDTNGDGDGQTPIEGCSNKGMAFGARLWGLKCDSGSGDLACLNDCHGGDHTVTLTNFFQASFAEGSRLSNHSWGADVYGVYDGGSEIVDIWAYDNDNNPSNGLTQNYLWFFAAGNSGSSAGSIGSPATAKNDVTGAAFYNGVDGSCWPGDSAPCNENKLVIYSSRGPTDDGRYGPEVAGASQYVTSPDDGTGYQEFNGTSCGTPSLTAQGTLIRDWLESVVGINPSASLVKALLLNSGAYLTSPTENLPGTGQGWGRPLLTNICDDFSSAECNQVRSLWKEDSFTSTGQSEQMDLFVLDSTTPLRCLLTWLDPPNLAGGGALINNLNLRVVAPDGTTYYIGNDFTGQWSNTNGSTYDSLNNSEGVRVQNPQAGLWQIRVLAGNIAQSPQPWTVVCSGKITDQSSDGIVKLDRELYNCSSTLNIMVSDADLKGNGTQNVTIWSNYESTPETITLTENPAGSGIFRGTLPLTSNPPSNGDGYLSVQHNNTITVRYIDLNDGKGGTNVPKEDTATTDCQGPIISNVQVPDPTLKATSACITWSTDEISNSKVYYASTLPPTNSATDPSNVTSHNLCISGLDQCTTYYYYIESCDPYGNCTIDNNGGNFYTFITKGVNIIFYDDVESGNIGWTAEAPWGITNESSASPTNSWTDSPGGPYNNDINISLTSPVLNLSGLSFAQLRFKHKYELESGYDYGYLEFTTNGSTWTTISTYNGVLSSWTDVEININPPYAGSSNFQFRFRITSDGYVQKDGWYIDDIAVESYRSCSYGMLTFDKDCYRNNDTINITVTDLDLNQNPNLQETVLVTVLSDTESSGETVILTETGTNSTTFVGSINTTTNPPPSPGILSISNGDSIIGRYFDEDDGSGNSRWAEDNALADPLAPTISNVLAQNVTGNSAEIIWQTNEVSNSRVIYDTLVPPSTYEAYSSSYVSNHLVQLTNLDQCTTYYYYVQSTDVCGNLTTDNNNGSYFTFETGMNVNPTHDSTDVPKPINDNQTITSNIIVSDDKIIEKVTVKIGNITHTFDGDLDIFLIAPDNTRVELSTDNGSTGDNYIDTIFDDEASTSITSGTAPFTGTFKPEGSLATLIGKNAQGTWKLEISDDASSDTGTLNSWSLTLRYPEQACGPSLEYQSSNITDTCNGTGSGSNDGIIDSGEDVLLQITLYNNGTSNTTGVSATISTSTPGVTITDNFATFPDIAVDESKTSLPNHFSFRVDPNVTCGTEINFNLEINSNEGNWSDTFKLTVGQVIPGGGIVLDENFSSGIPANWTIVDGGSGGGSSATWTTLNPCSRAPGSPIVPPFAIVDSDCAGSSATQDEQLITPVLNLSNATSVTLEYDHYFYWYSGGQNEIGDVDVKSSNTGGNWVNVRRYQGVSSGPEHITVDITTQAAGASDVQIRFHYYQASYEWYWIVDNVKVTYTSLPGCQMNPCTPAVPNIIYSSYGTITEITGDGDGWYERGEKFSVQVTLTNNGNANATGVTANLEGNGITVCNNPGNFGSIPVSGTSSFTYEFVIDNDFAPCGSEIGFDITTKTSNEITPAGPDEFDKFSINVGQINGYNTVTLFGPDDLANLNNWTLSNYQGASTSTCHSAADAQSNLNGTSTMTKTNPVSTIGYKNIRVNYDWHVTNTAATQYLDWSLNGTDWNQVASINTTTWLCNQSTLLPVGAEEQPTLYIRFRTVSNQAARRGEVDYISITGDVPQWDCTYVGSGSCGGGTPPPEISTGSSYPDDSISWSGKDTILWNSTPTAEGYRLYRGLQASLPNLLNENPDFCLRYEGTETQRNLAGDNPSQGVCYYYLVTAYNGAGEGSAGPGRILNSTGNCP